MNKFFLTLIALALANNALADQLDGLAIFDTLIPALVIGIIFVVILILAGIVHFSKKNNKDN